MIRPHIVRNSIRRLAYAPSYARHNHSLQNVEAARAHCQKQLEEHDYDAHLIRRLVPQQAQDVYVALRALNLELARITEAVSNPTLGAMRIQFWKDAVNNSFTGRATSEPVTTLLGSAAHGLQEHAGRQTKQTIKFWTSRLIQTRGKHLDNPPFTSMDALEDYAENIYSTMMYATLSAIPMRSIDMDHLASHIGKAAGIAALLRSIPQLVAPQITRMPHAGAVSSVAREPTLLLPLDIMAEHGVKEEDVFRNGPQAEGLSEAVFAVATRANDHLITAREMMKRLRVGQGAGHDFEHQHESEHTDEVSTGNANTDIETSFGILMEAVPVQHFLDSLQSVDFDVFSVKTAGWRGPWRMWRAISSKNI